MTVSRGILVVWLALVPWVGAVGCGVNWISVCGMESASPGYGRWYHYIDLGPSFMANAVWPSNGLVEFLKSHNQLLFRAPASLHFPAYGGMDVYCGFQPYGGLDVQLTQAKKLATIKSRDAREGIKTPVPSPIVALCILNTFFIWNSTFTF